MRKEETIKKINDVQKKISKILTSDLGIIKQGLFLKKQEKELDSARNHLKTVYMRLSILIDVLNER